MAGDPLWDNVVLLMHMEDFTDEKGHTITPNGTAVISSIDPKFGVGSLLLDGNSDYLTIPKSSDFIFADGDVTIELFANFNAQPGVYSGDPGITLASCWHPTGTDAASREWALSLLGANLSSISFLFEMCVGSTKYAVTATVSIALNTWHHFAGVRDGSVLRLFLDGIQVGAAGIAGLVNIIEGATDVYIGRLVNPIYSYYVPGKLDEFRITKGIARYTEDFTPPIEAFPIGPYVPPVEGATYRITGKTTLAGVPAPATLRLYEEVTGEFRAEVESDPLTGEYEFYDTSAQIIASGDLYLDNVVLLLHMDGENLSTLFVDETGKVVTAFGNAKIATGTKKYGTGSGLFDGVGDFISLLDSDDWWFSSLDFTIETWCYLTSAPNAGQGATLSAQVVTYSGTGLGHWLYIYNSGTALYIVFLFGDGTETIQVLKGLGGSSFALNSWHHFAVCRDTNIIRIFVDGIQVGLDSDVTGKVFVNVSSVLRLGVFDAGGSHALNGYLDDFRITKGVGRYTDDFTPPTEALSFEPYQEVVTGGVMGDGETYHVLALFGEGIRPLAHGPITPIVTSAPVVVTDEYWDNVVLLMHMDNLADPTTFLDEKGRTITAHGSVLQVSANSRFNSSSGLFNGLAGNYLSVPYSNELDVVTGDFTLEGWLYAAQLPLIYAGIYSTRPASGSIGAALRLQPSGAILFTITGVNDSLIITSGLLSTEEWHHVAVSRSGNAIRIFIDGVLAGSATTSLSGVRGSACAIGAAYDFGDYSWNGLIDEFRITFGIARYTADFTPPAYAFPNQ